MVSTTDGNLGTPGYLMVIEEKGAGTVIGGGGEGGLAADVADSWLILTWCQHVPPRGSRSLLQGIFPNQGSNPGLPHCGQILYQLSHWGSPRRLEWVVYPFSSGSSRPRNRTEVFWIARGFFSSWVTHCSLCYTISLCCLLRTYLK